MKVIYFDCFSGISGDMCLGALVDAGIDPEVLRLELAKLPINDYELKWQRVYKNGIGATDITVETVGHNHKHRQLDDIEKIIDGSSLNLEIKTRAKEVFQRIARAEAKIHQMSVDQIHFHEVGAVDAIIDIMGTIIGLVHLGVERVMASPLPLGSGFVKCMHGIIPVPAPATLELLKEVPVYYGEAKHEVVTPTGAALITTLADYFGPMPPMVIHEIGYGAGKAELITPNLLRVLIGEAVETI